MITKILSGLFISIIAVCAVIISLSLGNVGNAHFQNETDSSKNKSVGNEKVFPRKMKKIIKKHGWDVVKEMNFTSQHDFPVKFQNIDGVPVKITLSGKYPEQTCKLENYLMRSKEELEIQQIGCKVYSIFSYEFNGKIFAYKFDFAAIDLKTNNQLGMIIPTYYIDNDGDKVFEELNTSMELETVPDWVKQ